MATKTSNYQFDKPSMTDSADINVLNGNMDKLDTLLKAMENKEEIELGTKTIGISAFSEQIPISPGFPWRGALVIEGVTSIDIVNLYGDDSTSDLGILSQKNESYDGGVYVYCRTKPTQTLNFFRVTKKRGL